MQVKKRRDGVYVDFKGDGPDWGYYAHGIKSIGEASEDNHDMTSLWGWVNHLRSKRWWGPYTESEFVKKVSEALDYGKKQDA